MTNSIDSSLTKLILVVLLLCLGAGCSQQDAAETAAPGKPRIALIMKSLANEFFINMANGAKSHQAQNADSYELLVNGIKN